MRLINRSLEWDKVLDAIEDSALGAAAARLLDPALAALERHAGLSEASRFALFGEKEIPYGSLIMSYMDALKKKAAEERASEPARDGSTAESFASEPENKRIDIGGAAERIRRAAAEAFEKSAKILPGDTMTPRERVERHIRFEKADRVAVAPLWGYHVARAGGISVRDFMTDGRLAARAARRAWDIYGGFDMLPTNFPMGYMFPLVPESHSRFCSNWVLPEDDELPKLDEHPLPYDYDTFLREGFTVLLRTEGGRLLHELRRMVVQGALFSSEIAIAFPRSDLFYPYAMGVINHPADLLSMWLGFDRFMMDCAMDPAKVREACERLGPGLAELGMFPGRLLGVNQVLYGVSRVSGSYISRKMFDSLFAGTFLDQVRRTCAAGFKFVYHLDNDYTPFLDFFLELPKQSGFLHLDQTDIFAAKEVLHGHLCLMGNLHPGLTAAGSVEQVTAQCERLIKEVGAGGGFILSSACEVPINAPVENLKAVKNAVDRWGWY